MIVWIHGGNFARGSAAEYEPDYILDQEVVLVTIQYRSFAKCRLQMKRTILVNKMLSEKNSDSTNCIHLNKNQYLEGGSLKLEARN